MKILCCVPFNNPFKKRSENKKKSEIFLPNELLVKILRLLPIRQVFSSCNLVCKHWQEAVQEVFNTNPNDSVCPNPNYNDLISSTSETWLLIIKHDRLYRKLDIRAMSDREKNNIFAFPHLPLPNLPNTFDSLVEVTSKRGLVFCLFGTLHRTNNRDGIVKKIFVINPLTGYIKKLLPPKDYNVFYWRRRIGSLGEMPALDQSNLMRVEFNGSCYYIAFRCDASDLPNLMIVYDLSKDSWKEVRVRAQTASAQVDFSKVLQGNFFFLYPITPFVGTTHVIVLILLAYNVEEDTWSQFTLKRMDSYLCNIHKNMEIHQYNGRLLACFVELGQTLDLPTTLTLEPCCRIEKSPCFTQWKVCEILPISNDLASFVNVAEFPISTPQFSHMRSRAQPMAIVDGHLICFSWMIGDFSKSIYEYKNFKDFAKHGEHRLPPVVYDISQDKWHSLFDPSREKQWLRFDYEEYGCTSLFSPWQAINFTPTS